MKRELNLQTTYQAIVDAASKGNFVSYGELAKANGVDWQEARFVLNRHLGELMELCAKRGWPLLSAIVVNKSNLSSGLLDGTAQEGFITAAQALAFDVQNPVEFIETQQQQVFDWALEAPSKLRSDETTGRSNTQGPRFVRLFGPLLDALRELGGSADPRLAKDKVIEVAAISEEELSRTTKGGHPQFANEISWVRFYLCRAGLIEDTTNGRWTLTDLGNATHLSQAAALALFRDVKSRFRDTSSDEDQPAPDPLKIVSRDLFEDVNRRFWFVGANWDGTDQTERFLQEGIWTNGYEEKFRDLVERMNPGDLIAIKAAFTKKYDLPFNNRGKLVSCMRIKATGRIIGETQDGRTVKVEWDQLDDPKDWYFYTYRVTIVEANVADEHARRLILFTFSNHNQDYDYFLRIPYWEKKYGVPVFGDADSTNDEDEPEPFLQEEELEHYGVSDVLNDGCFLPETEIRSAIECLRLKKNLILQGPPGTGKTWLAKRLGYVLLETRDRRFTGKRMRVIQFHPSLSYEDFVRGWRPDGNGQLKLIDGIFLDAIGAARAEPDIPFVVIVEEINRGNPALIFGELLTLLENDKRREEEAIELAYQRRAGERLFIPENLFVIGTMNIADRSLALVDLAFRRRFAFVNLETMLNEHWESWCRKEGGLDQDTVSIVQQALMELNDELARDRSLGPQFKIGHSYVTPTKGEVIRDPQAWFQSIVQTEIAPLLGEYWYDNPDAASSAVEKLLATNFST